MIRRLYFVLFWCTQLSLAIKWLSKDVFEQTKWTAAMCSMQKFHFTNKQKTTCRRHIALMKYVSKSAAITREECQAQFNNRKWNCLSIYLAPNYGIDLVNATKESAVVYALSSAALTLSTALDCARGVISHCGCTGVKNHNLFFDHACDPVFDRAIAFAREFTMPGRRKIEKIRMKAPTRALRMEIQKHNRKVGWKATREAYVKRCKCMGDTGNCPRKVCYKALPNFKAVATNLRSRYDNAVHVIRNEQNFLVGKNIENEKELSRNLIYADRSVDKCGLTGLYVSNRECSMDPDSENNCNNVCCRGKYKKRTIKVLSSCNCKFKFCCEVVCEQCYLEKKIYVCTETN